MQRLKYNRLLAAFIILTGYGLIFLSRNASSNDSPQRAFGASSMLALMLLFACGLFSLLRTVFRPAPVRK